MLLKSITIENFRGIEKLVLDLDDITVLIGENNTGKTSILEALYLCLSRSLGRRSSPFDEYDYHLPSKDAVPTACAPIVITLVFAERKPDEWPDAVVQALGKVIQVRADDLQEVTLQVTSSFSVETKEYEFGWEFLDNKGASLPKNPRVLMELQQLVPVFLLGAMRDAGQQFHAKSQFWGAFTRNLQLDDEKRKSLEEQLEAINQSVLDAHKPFDEIKTRIAKTAALVPLSKTEQVSVEALPARVFDMLNRTQVKLAATTGAKLPVTEHGAGTQSLAVMFLFEAFLNAKLGEAYDKDSEPLIALEEPEAHLHPSAVRALWTTLEGLKGQKLVATHSGDLLSAVPLSSIRRLARKNGEVKVFRVAAGTLTADEERRIGYHVRCRRGGLLFAKCWLLVEGESEFWFAPESARLCGVDFEAEGISCVEYAQCHLVPLVKLAQALGIEWHVLADGDTAGAANVKNAESLLGGSPREDHISQLAENDLEHCLWKHGYRGIYESAVGKPQMQMVQVKPEDDRYPTQAIKAAVSSTSKPYLALAVIDAARQAGSPGLPDGLKQTIKRAVTLARR